MVSERETGNRTGIWIGRAPLDNLAGSEDDWQCG